MSELDLKRTDEEWIRYNLKSISSRLSYIENIFEVETLTFEDIEKVREEIISFRRMTDMILDQYGL